jgi:fucose permease
MGFAFSGIWPMIVGMATARNPENSGTASGLTISAGSVGCIIQPFILGPLLENNHHKAVFCLLALCLLLSASIMTASYWLRTRRR